MKNVAIIPAKRDNIHVPSKHLKNLAGKPLILHCLKSAVNAKAIDEVFVYTECPEIARLAKENGATPLLVEDSVGSLKGEVYLRKAVKEASKNTDIENLFFIQATSPLTESEDFDNAFALYKEEGYDSMLSVCQGRGGLSCGGFLWNKEGQSINYDYKDRKQKQDLDSQFLENGAFYIMSKKGLEENENRLHGKIGFYEMPRLRSLEIDHPEDFEVAEKILSLKNEEQ